jgi:tRNA(fMet)-specific endonuclease VapC
MSVAAASFALCLPSVGELWYMVLNSTRVEENEQDLQAFLAAFPLLSFDDHAAREYGQIRVQLRRLGRPIPEVDVQIAAIARSGGFIVLMADAHFSYVPGVQTENWLQ